MTEGHSAERKKGEVFKLDKR